MEESASTSTAWTDAEKTKLLQQALSQAGLARVERQKRIKQSSQREASSQMESAKKKIRSHPLMPAVQILLCKCENAIECFDSSIFDLTDLTKLLESMKQSGISPNTDDEIIDSLMWDTVIELRKQLAEMERVASLAREFKTKYEGTLRKRVSQEALVGTSMDSDDESNGYSPPTNEQGVSRFLSANPLATLTTANGMLSLPIPAHSLAVDKTDRRNKTVPKFDFTSIEKNAASLSFAQFWLAQQAKQLCSFTSTSTNDKDGTS